MQEKVEDPLYLIEVGGGGGGGGWILRKCQKRDTTVAPTRLPFLLQRSSGFRASCCH